MSSKVKKQEKSILPKELLLKKGAIEKIANFMVDRTMKQGGTFSTIDVAGRIVDEIDRMGLSESALLILMNIFVIEILKQKGVIKK